MTLECDDGEKLIHQRKHGMSFEEARGSFEPGGDQLEIFDSEHSDVADRFIAIGPIERGLIVVVYTERAEDVTRIIGARLAHENEQSLYRSHMDRDR